MIAPHPIIPTWFTEVIFIAALSVGAAIVVVVMAAIAVESIIMRSDARRAKQEKGHMP